MSTRCIIKCSGRYNEQCDCIFAERASRALIYEKQTLYKLQQPLLSLLLQRLSELLLCILNATWLMIFAALFEMYLSVFAHF